MLNRVVACTIANENPHTNPEAPIGAVPGKGNVGVSSDVVYGNVREIDENLNHLPPTKTAS